VRRLPELRRADAVELRLAGVRRPAGRFLNALGRSDPQSDRPDSCDMAMGTLEASLPVERGKNEP